MRSETLLRLIWQDEVQPITTADEFRHAAAFPKIVPMTALVLKCAALTNRPVVMSDEVELMPALPLGDVLAEELNIDVPHGTMVVILPDRGGKPPVLSPSCDLGAAVGDVLLYTQLNVDIPVEQEIEALYVMAHSVARLATTAAVRELGVDARGFCLGLGQSLCAHWEREKRTGLVEKMIFNRPDFLWQPQLRGFLESINPGVVLPDPTLLPGDLMFVSREGPIPLPEWLDRVGRALRLLLGAPLPVSGPDLGLMSRFNLQ